MSYHVTEPLPSVPSTNYIHYGRGGAGNYMRATPSTLSKTASIASTTSSKKALNAHPSTKFSSGRGGAGNMHDVSERAIFRFDEELARERAREEVAAPVYHIGRGGAGNWATSADVQKSESLQRASLDDSSSKSDRRVSGADAIWGKISGTFSRS